MIYVHIFPNGYLALTTETKLLNNKLICDLWYKYNIVLNYISNNQNSKLKLCFHEHVWNISFVCEIPARWDWNIWFWQYKGQSVALLSSECRQQKFISSRQMSLRNSCGKCFTVQEDKKSITPYFTEEWADGYFYSLIGTKHHNTQH